jgi:tellurite resistance-related uncharacterized protein
MMGANMPVWERAGVAAALLSFYNAKAGTAA